MINPAKSATCGGWGLMMLWVSTVGLLALPGCSDRPTPSLAPKPVKLARMQKLAVIRLSDPTIAQEPPDAEIKAGLKYSGLDESSYTLTDHDAKGDLAAVPGLIDAAVSDGADLVFTLLPETTVARGREEPENPDRLPDDRRADRTRAPQERLQATAEPDRRLHVVSREPDRPDRSGLPSEGAQAGHSLQPRRPVLRHSQGRAHPERTGTESSRYWPSSTRSRRCRRRSGC